MNPKAKTDIRPEPKPATTIRTQQVLTMLGILLMFAMALSWLWTPVYQPEGASAEPTQVSPPPSEEKLDLEVHADGSILFMRPIVGSLPR